MVPARAAITLVHIRYVDVPRLDAVPDRVEARIVQHLGRRVGPFAETNSLNVHGWAFELRRSTVHGHRLSQRPSPTPTIIATGKASRYDTAIHCIAVSGEHTVVTPSPMTR